MALATLTIDINARLANIERDLGKAAHIAEKNGKKMEAAFAGAQAAFIGLGAALGAGTILSGIKTVIDGADQLQKASQKYGIAVEQLSALKYAGELSDVSLEAIGNGLKKLSVNMLDTAAGTGEAKDAFKALGLSVTAASGGLKSSDQVLAEISDKFAGMEDGAGKTSIAVKLFGRAGTDLIPLLNQGSKGLADMKKEAEQLGAIVGGDLTRKSEEFNDNLTRLSRTFDAFKVSLAGSILPDLVKFSGTLVEATKASGGLLKGIEMILSLPVAGSVYDNFDAIKKEMENIDRKIAEMEAKPFFLRGLNLSGLKKNREELEQQLKFVESIIHQRGGGKEIFDFGPAVWQTKNKAPDLAGDRKKKAKADLSEIEGYAEKIRNAVGTAITDNSLTRAREYADQVAFLDKLFFDAGLDADIYAAAMDKISGATDKAASEKSRLNDLLANTPSANIEKTRDDMILLAQAFESGRLRAEQYFEAVAANLPKFESALDEMTEFTRQAARNMQDAMGSFFFDLMEGKMEDMGTRFEQTINKMLADLMASQIMNWLTGDFGKTGKMGGALGGLLENFGGARAEGGPVMAGRAYLVGERRPELFVPSQNGTILPHAGGDTFIINVPPGTAPEIRRAAGQGMREAVAALGRARRYA